jgi:cytochrome c oxidase cbb3-type subunit 3
MTRFPLIVTGVAALVVIVMAAGLSGIVMPGAPAKPPAGARYNGMVPAAKLLRVPVTGVFPGGTPVGLNPDMENPLKNDPDAAARGQKDFARFNCIGCHMPHGGGGMGPALSNHVWIYRKSAANLYLDIAQGRSAGMPAFGAMLPDRTIWELVAYIQNLSDSPDHSFGITTSATPDKPVEQVPAGQADSVTPWKDTEPMPPNGEKNSAGEQPPDAPLPAGAETSRPPLQTVPAGQPQ